MVTRRDVFVAVVAVAATAGIGAAQQDLTMRTSAVFDWDTIPVTKTEVGTVRQFFRAPTVALDELELHVTTLNPGQASHPPHQHVNEELIIVREGTVETLSNGTWKRLGPGSVIFNASNVLHGIRNVGTTPATYHVINWKSTRK
jgi:XRE family transcriptional regulator, regulator of sulfur utilization